MAKTSTKQSLGSSKLSLNITGLLIIIVSIVTLIGFFGEGGWVGKQLGQLFQAVLGKFAWIGPFATGVFGFILVIRRPKIKTPKQSKEKTPSRSKEQRGELASKGTGFKEYFSDPDPLDEKKKSEPFTELEEVGRDFKTYFGGPGKGSKLVSKGNGFEEYFAEFDAEVAAAGAEPAEEPVQERSFKPQVVKPQNSFRDFMGQILEETNPKEAKPSAERELEVVRTAPAPKEPTRSFKPEQLRLEVPAEEDIPEKTTPITLPPLVLLDPTVPTLSKQDDNSAKENAKVLEEVLSSFGVKVKVTEISQGPTITRYEVQPSPGIKISRIVNLADDIALALAAPDVRIEAPIPGKSAVGIEVPNKKVSMVKFREVLESEEFGKDSKLKVALGKDIAGKAVAADLSRMPHLLVAGATGSGKSVCMNAIITSILYNAKPDEVKFLLIDPKMVELTKYNGIPHLIAPVVTDPKKAAGALRWVVNEMETRYELFAAAGVRDITRYNEVSGQAPLPFVVVLIDELADLMMVAPGDVEETICRLAQMARAAGIHLVVATQRPSVDVITGIIKANIPSRIAFAVSSQIDSRTILDGNGAEKLLGKGDMLYYPLGMSKPLRVQGCFLSEPEVDRVVQHWKKQAKPEYISTHFEEQTLSADDDMAEDELFAEAARLFITSGMASVSLLQRRLRVGYTRAARLMDLMEQRGVVGGFEGSKPRQVLMTISEFEEKFLNQ